MTETLHIGARPRSTVVACPCGNSVRRFLCEPTRRFCSNKCARKGQRRQKTGRMIACRVCTQEFYVTSKRKAAKFCSVKCSNEGKKVQGQGSRYTNEKGYVEVYFPSHPDANSAGRIMEHRLVAQEKYGRRLNKGEHVHHVNGVRDDNRPANLVVMGEREHLKLTRAQDNAMRAELAEYRRLYGPLPQPLQISEP